jgi:hypothetical protein
MEERYQKAPGHPRGVEVCDMLMGIPFGYMRKDNPLTGLDKYDIIRSTFKPKTLSEVPSAQEVKAGLTGDGLEDEPEDEVGEDEASEKSSDISLLVAILNFLLRYISPVGKKCDK